LRGFWEGCRVGWIAATITLPSLAGKSVTPVCWPGSQGVVDGVEEDAECGYHWEVRGDGVGGVEWDVGKGGCVAYNHWLGLGVS